MRAGSVVVVQVVTVTPRAVLRPVAEELFEFGKQVGGRAKQAGVGVVVSVALVVRHHFGAVVAVKGVAFDEGGAHVLTAENARKGARDLGRARAR